MLIIILFSISSTYSFANAHKLPIRPKDIEFEKQLMEEKSNQLIIKFNESRIMDEEDINLEGNFRIINMIGVSKDTYL